MSTVARGVDSLACYLTGGSTNADPAASLGGAISTHARARVFGRLGLVSSPIPAVRIDHVFGANGEGDGELSIDGDGALSWTPPGATIGDAVALAEGASAIVAGSDENKAVRVYREADLRNTGVSPVSCVSAMNGVLGGADLTSAQRIAGRSTYRAIAFKALSSSRVAELRVWLPPVAGSQATWSLAVETPVAGSVQTIADEATAPTGLAFVAATSSATALYVPSVDAGEWVAVWIRRTFPAGGVVAARELVDVAWSYMGAP